MRLAKLVAAVLVLLAGSNIRAEEKSRTFPQYQCRCTLPGDDWSWVDPNPVPNAICAVRNGAGVVFVLAVFPAPKGAVINADFVAGADESAAKHMTKRGGAITTFKDLPCYEYRGLVQGVTAVVRVVLANGHAYRIELLGGADPVENRPDFEAIMNRFEFTVPPVAPVAISPEQNASWQLGRVAGGCLLAAILLGLGRRAFRSK